MGEEIGLRIYVRYCRYASAMNRKNLMSSKESSSVTGMLLPMMYHQTLPTTSKIIMKNRGIFQINPELQKMFNENQ